jgi:hypothetical protein
MHQQLSMTGDDWRSDRDIKAQAKAEAKRKKAGLVCADKLMAASKAISEYLAACNECRDASGCRGVDDGRLVLIGNITEYAGWLKLVYEKPDR